MSHRNRLQLRLSGRADQADAPPHHPEGGGDSRLSGAVRRARDADAAWLGHRRHPGDRRHHRPRRRAEGDRPGRRRHHQRRLDPALLRQDRRRRHHHAHRRGDHHPDPPPHPGKAAAGRPDPGLPGADPGAAALAGAARDRDAQDARPVGIRRHACAALRGHRHPRPHRHRLRLSGAGERPLHHAAVADPEVRQSEDGHEPGAAIVRRRAAKSASTRCRPTPR